MSKDSELFEEAVADASAIREISLENAKEGLLERFTPKLKKIVQDKMLEASEEEDDEELEMDIDADGEEDDANGDGSDEDGADDTDEEPEDEGGDEDGDDEQVDEDYELTEEDMEEITEYVMDLGEDVAFDNRHSDPDTSDRFSNQQPQHDNDQLADLDDIGTGYDDEQISDVVLDEIQKELDLKESDSTNPNRSMDEIEDILNELEEGDDEYMDEPMDDEYMDDYMDDEDEHMGDDYMGYMEDSDLDEGEIEYEIDLREYGVTDVDRDPMNSLGDVDSTYLDVVNDLVDDTDDYDDFDTEGPGARMNMTEPEADPLGEDTEFDVSGVLSEEEDEGNQLSELRQQNKKLRKERDKARKAAKILREKVRSSKLLNKKLVYTNKLFNNLSLNSKQRQTVVESFEEAETEREVELTFSNLADTLQEQEGGAQRSQQLDESANRAVNNNRGGGIDDSKRIIKEDTDMKERMQELAGIL